jgi:BirA family biotin operon repressor/biotin-[acetyl-CoA-carboxylase] ligase
MNSIAVLTQRWSEKNQVPTFYLESVGSTQTVAKKEFSGQTSELLVLANEQTAGRGRSSNLWNRSITPGGQLFSTWCFRLSKAPFPVLTALVGLSLYQSFLKVWPGLPVSLKAPNDIYLNHKKIGGILIEVVAQKPNHDLFVGIGLNLFDHPQSVETAGCLLDVLSKENLIQNWNSFLSQVHTHLVQLKNEMPDKLSATHCEQIKQALNVWPGLAKSYTAVLPDGGLQQGSLITHWSEL